MKIKNNRKGFTLAEMLMTVAIILILAGVSFVGVIHYLKYLKQLENDGIAKEIFIAAQNHLSMASSQGFLGRTQFGKSEKPDDPENNIYYFVVNGIPNDDKTVLSLMLPFASIDETVRNGGSYIIRYQKNPAIVKDVFYASKTGRFNYTFNENEYNNLINQYTGDDKKSARRNYGSDNYSVIGYYGGAELDELTLTLKMPMIKVENADKLTVNIKNPNINLTDNGIDLKLVIKGKLSENRISIPLITQGIVSTYLNAASKYGSASSTLDEFTIVLDDITQSGTHFMELFCNITSINGSNGFQGTGPLLPGEDIEIKAIAFTNTKLANIAESAVSTTNSLFADDSSVDTNIAAIANIRHLENLSNELSGIGTNKTGDNSKNVVITNAKQTVDLSWETFKENLKSPAGSGGGTSGSPDSNAVNIHTLDPNKFSTDAFMPVNPEYALNYMGEGHQISDIVVNTSENAGLFGTLVNTSKVSDLNLVDFTVASTEKNAGALVGSAGSIEITNVLAHNEKIDDSALISGKESTGGLVGIMTSGKITKSAAAVYVSSDKAAGGLVGTADNVAITSSYAGGHTFGGSYIASGKVNDTNKAGRTNVVSTGGTAGGLVGESSATIQYSYSTCSVSGTTAGGLAGSVSGGSISNSYAVGLVEGTAAGAFVGSGTPSGSDNYYFEIMNEGMPAVGTASGSISGISAIDEFLASYQSFFGKVTDTVAYPYDPSLLVENRGKYYYPSVSQLGHGETVKETDFVYSHYGDWCSPETKVINTSNPASGGTGE